MTVKTFGDPCRFAIDIQDSTRPASDTRFIRMRFRVGMVPVGDFELEDILTAAVMDMRVFVEASESLSLPDRVVEQSAAELVSWVRGRDRQDVQASSYEEDIAWGQVRRGIQFGVYSTGAISSVMVLVIDLPSAQRVVVADEEGAVLKEVVISKHEVQECLRDAIQELEPSHQA